MIGAATIAILLVMSLPAFLPRWSHVAWVAFASAVAIGTVFLWLLRDLDNHPSGGDGPAFFGMVLLAGAAQIIVVASVLVRVLVHWLARSLSPAVRTCIAKALLGMALVASTLSLLMYLASFVAEQLIGFAAVLSFSLFWLGLALQFAPSNSFKPTPPRGAA